MALTLSLSATINTDRTTITLTDTTADWNTGGNINFTQVAYAEIYAGIKGALYGPVILTNTFTDASAQSDLVFELTPSLLGLTGTTFDDAIHEYHYGVSALSSPSLVQRNIWNLLTSYSFPISNTNNKIPFTFSGDTSRSYQLQATYNVPSTDPGVNPRMTLVVNYQDGTSDTEETAIPQTGTATVISATVNVNRQKEIRDVTGFLFNEDRGISADRSGTITNITLNKQDFNLESAVERALISEKTKARQNREAIGFRKSFLCGRRSFKEHEKFIVEVAALDSVTVGATRGLADEAEDIIDVLNDNTDC